MTAEKKNTWQIISAIIGATIAVCYFLWNVSIGIGRIAIQYENVKTKLQTVDTLDVHDKKHTKEHLIMEARFKDEVIKSRDEIIKAIK